MMTMLFAGALALQAAPPQPAAPSTSAEAISLDDLPIDQAASARCAMAFAIVSRWQKSGDARGTAYPDMEAVGGREFFVRTMAQLMDSAGWTRDGIVQLTFREVEATDNPAGEARIKAMMPACQMMKSAAGL